MRQRCVVNRALVIIILIISRLQSLIKNLQIVQISIIINTTVTQLEISNFNLYIQFFDVFLLYPLLYHYSSISHVYTVGNRCVTYMYIYIEYIRT